MAGRIVGKQGALYLFLSGSWVQIADIYDWQLSMEGVTLDASIKGDSFQRSRASHLQGRLTAKRYVQVPGGKFALGDLCTTGARYDWAVASVDTGVANFSTNTSAQAQGTGYVVRATMGAPRGMVTDDLEIQLDTIVGVA